MTDLGTHPLVQDEPPAALPRLSVIVPCFNHGDTLGGQLEALVGQDYAGWWEVIVADNGSTDHSRTVAETYVGRLPRFRVVDASLRRGASYARNTGASAAAGDFLLFCDADDEVGDDWLPAVAAAFRHNDFVASSVEIGRLNEPWVQQVRRPPTPGERLSFPPYLAHAGGSGLGVRRELFEAVSGFDESFPRLQDTDFCIRVQLTGTPLVFAPGAVIHCRYQTSWLEIYRQARSYAEGAARIYAQYAPNGAHRPHWWMWPLRHWFAMAKAASRAWDVGSRAQLAWVLGWQVGRVRGSLRYRVPAV
jgi:glycosyltransferase involved in cell wall biosynthesis